MKPQPDRARLKLSWRNIFVVAAIVSLLLVYPLLWLRVISDPAQRTAADFLPFYAAGRIAITEGMSRVYDLEAQRQAEDAVLNETLLQYFASKGQTPTPQDLGLPIQPAEVNPFPHPPFIVPLLALLAHLDYLPAFVIWSLLMCALFIISAVVLLRLIPQARGQNKWILFFGTVLFFPGFFSIINGQDTALLLLGASLWVSGLLAGRDLLSGLGMAVTLVRPHLVLIFAPPFIFRRRRIWAFFCAGAGFLVLVSILMLGRSGVESYLRTLLSSANGEGYKFFNEDLMVNLIGFLRRLFPSVHASLVRLVGWIGFGLSIIYLSIVWIRNAEIKERHVGLAVIITILATPHIHYHDLALLLIPVYGVVQILLARKLLKLENAVLIPLVASILMFISFLLIPPLKYVLPYLLMVLLLAMLWFPEKIIFWHVKESES